MTHATAMIETYPKSINLDRRLLADCIVACVDCAQACTACADACLSEDMVAELTRCIRTDLDCAVVCDTTGRVLSPTHRLRRQPARRHQLTHAPRCTSTRTTATTRAAIRLARGCSRTCWPPTGSAGLDHTFLIMLVPLLAAAVLLLGAARRTYPRDVATALTSEADDRRRGGHSSHPPS